MPSNGLVYTRKILEEEIVIYLTEGLGVTVKIFIRTPVVGVVKHASSSLVDIAVIGSFIQCSLRDVIAHV